MIFPDAQCVVTATDIAQAVERMAQQLNQALLGEPEPLALVVMQGGLMLASDLLKQIRAAVELDFVQVSRYQGGIEPKSLLWRVMPQARIEGRTLLLIDDILDSGLTLKALRDHFLQQGAVKVLSLVLGDKARPDPQGLQQADICGLRLPDRFLFGYGMDYQQHWRHLPDIYALNDAKTLSEEKR